MKVLLLLGLLIFQFGVLNAQDNASYLGDLGVIVVTPTRHAGSLSDYGTNVDVITKKEINDKGARTVAEALESIVGISDVSCRGTRGATRDIRIRSGGDSSNQVLIMIDNQPINNAALGGGELEDIPVDFIERIEIIRGPSSAVWGANALGGVINIITQKPASDQPLLRMNVDEGTFNASKYNLLLQYNNGSDRVLISGAVEDSDGWRDNSGYDGNDYIVKAGKTIEGFGDIDGQFILHKSVFGVPGQNTTDIADYDGDSEKVAQTPDAAMNKLKRYLQIESNNEVSETLSIKTRLYANYVDSRYEAPAAFTDDLSQTVTYGVEIQGNTQFGFVAGGNISWDNFTRNDKTVTPAVTDVEENTSNRAVFIQQTIEYNPATFILGLRYDAHSVFEGQLNPQGTIVYRMSEALKLSANVGRSFRAPTFEDLYSPETSWPASAWGPAGDTKGNTDLKPETAWGYDIGVEHGFRDILLSRLTFFRSNIENLIEWTEVDPDPDFDKWRPSNVGEAYNQGIEFELNSKIFHKMYQTLNYTYLESKGKDNDDTEYTTLQYTPHNRINYKLNCTAPEEIMLSAGINYTGKVAWKDDFDISHKLDEYILVNTGISKRIKSIGLFFRVKNLFDKKYQTREDFPLPGRTFTFVTEVKF